MTGIIDGLEVRRTLKISCNEALVLFQIRFWGSGLLKVLQHWDLWQDPLPPTRIFNLDRAVVVLASARIARVFPFQILELNTLCSTRPSNFLCDSGLS